VLAALRTVAIHEDELVTLDLALKAVRPALAAALQRQTRHFVPHVISIRQYSIVVTTLSREQTAQHGIANANSNVYRVSVKKFARGVLKQAYVVLSQTITTLFLKHDSRWTRAWQRQLEQTYTIS